MTPRPFPTRSLLPLLGAAFLGAILPVGSIASGNLYVVTSAQGVTLSASAQSLSYRFTAQGLTDLTEVQIFIASTSIATAVTYDVVLAPDSTVSLGTPDLAAGTTLALALTSLSPLGWTSLSVVPSFAMTPGKVYHLVLRSNGAAPASSNNWAAFAVAGSTLVSSATPNHLVPATQAPDPQADVIQSTGGPWTSLGGALNPVYLLSSAGNITEGQPYALSDVPGVDGASGGSPHWVSERFTYQGANASGIDRLRSVLRRVGTPASPVSCLILEESGTPVTLAGWPALAAPSSNFDWVTFGGASIPMTTNGIYRIAFFSTSGDTGTNSYQAAAGRVGSGNSIRTGTSYGGSTAGVLSTSTGGASWSDDPQADLAFDLWTAPPTATPTATSTLVVTPVLPTPTKTPTLLPTATPTVTATSTLPTTLGPDLALDLNFFDPAAGPLGIDVKVPRAGRVKVAVYNISGEKVSALLDKDLPAGPIRIYWNGHNTQGDMVGNAVYFLVTETPDWKMVRKVVVLK